MSKVIHLIIICLLLALQKLRWRLPIEGYCNIAMVLSLKKKLHCDFSKLPKIKLNVMIFPGLENEILNSRFSKTVENTTYFRSVMLNEGIFDWDVSPSWRAWYTAMLAHVIASPQSKVEHSPADLPGWLIEPGTDSFLPVFVKVGVQEHSIPAGGHVCLLPWKTAWHTDKQAVIHVYWILFPWINLNFNQLTLLCLY